MLRFHLCCALVLALGVPAAGSDPPKDEPLPPPRVVPQPEQPVYVLPPMFIRPNRYDVWQYHAVDRRGRFRPLVVASPYGPYYLLTGKPYPFAQLHALDWALYVSP